jgi:hypothetical protein
MHATFRFLAAIAVLFSASVADAAQVDGLQSPA